MITDRQVRQLDVVLEEPVHSVASDWSARRSHPDRRDAVYSFGLIGSAMTFALLERRRALVRSHGATFFET